MNEDDPGDRGPKKSIAERVLQALFTLVVAVIALVVAAVVLVGLLWGVCELLVGR